MNSPFYSPRAERTAITLPYTIFFAIVAHILLARFLKQPTVQVDYFVGGASGFAWPILITESIFAVERLCVK